MKRLIALVFSLLLGSSAAIAEIDWRKLEKSLAERVRTPAFLDNVLHSYGLTGVPRRVVRDHLIELYKRDEIISLIVKEMRLAGVHQMDDRDSRDFGRRFGSELFVSYSIKGLNRLSADDQRLFLRFLSTWMRVATPTDCKKLLVTGATANALDNSAIEMRYYGFIQEEQLRSYFQLVRKGIYAEVNQYPSAKILNKNQIDLADAAFERELERKLKSGSVRYDVIKAIVDMNNASPEDACDAGKLLFDTIVDMRGFAGDLMVNKMIGSMQ